MQVRSISPGQSSGHGLGNGRDRYAQGFGPLPTNTQKSARRIFAHAGVHTDDVGRVTKRFGNLCGKGLTTGFIWTIDLCYQGRHHGRPGRHFHHLDTCKMLCCNFLKLRTEPLGNHVALVAAVVLVDQIDLQISLLGISAQIILAHQSVKSNG